MRRSRVFLAGSVILLLVGGLSVAVMAQTDGDEAVPPSVEFSGMLPCPGDYKEGTVETVFFGRLDEGSVIRREVRGSIQQQAVDGMGDPRLDGTMLAYMNLDSYMYIGTTDEARPGLASIVVRIQNDEGAWQGSSEVVSLPGIPLPEWGVVVLTGEDAYEGLTAVVANRLVDEPCGIEVRGYVIEGEMPPMPNPIEPPNE